jgi:hypothetical protein
MLHHILSIALLPALALCQEQGDTRVLECFAVDFDGNNQSPLTNDNLDFTRCCQCGSRLAEGMVETDLGPNDQPVLTALASGSSSAACQFNGPEYFKEWWNGGTTTQNFWVTIKMIYNKGILIETKDTVSK